jgi:hypothetical protein
MVRVAGADMAVAVDHILDVENAIADHQIIDDGLQFCVCPCLVAAALSLSLPSLSFLRHGLTSPMLL